MIIDSMTVICDTGKFTFSREGLACRVEHFVMGKSAGSVFFYADSLDRNLDALKLARLMYGVTGTGRSERPCCTNSEVFEIKDLIEKFLPY